MPHFEIHVSDIEAAKAFHAGLFGWTFTPMPGAEEVGCRLVAGDGIGPETGLTGASMRRIGAPPPTDCPGIGGRARVEDGQGNIVGMTTPAQEGN